VNAKRRHRIRWRRKKQARRRWLKDEFLRRYQTACLEIDHSWAFRDRPVLARLTAGR
jgi:hypothetical protein